MKKPDALKKKAVFNWSGGKDSALALQKTLQDGEYEVVSLLTAIAHDSDSTPLHGIPRELLKQQAESIGLPLTLIELPPAVDTAGYRQNMEECVRYFSGKGAAHFIFGDIFLKDIKSYREAKLQPFGITVVEPLWGKTSQQVMEEFLASGLQASIIAANAEILDERYIGRPVDRSLLDDLPCSADICGENGEYHTFCHSGGIFRHPVNFSLGSPVKVDHKEVLESGCCRIHSSWTARLEPYN